MATILNRLELEMVEAGSSTMDLYIMPPFVVTASSLEHLIIEKDFWDYFDQFIDHGMGDYDQAAFTAYDNGQYGVAATEWAWGWSSIIGTYAHDLTVGVVQMLTSKEFWQAHFENVSAPKWWHPYP